MRWSAQVRPRATLPKPPTALYDPGSLETAAPLNIEFTKRADRTTILRCVRGDGSVTWQRNDGRYAAFFPVHDLMHYAVETELGFQRGFYGLIAEGWNISETTGKTPRGVLPSEALEVEYLVSAFSAERARAPVAAADFNEQARAFASTRGIPTPRRLTDQQLARVRDRFERVAGQWRELRAGETLCLKFPHCQAVVSR